MVDELSDALSPLLAEIGLELFDLQVAARTVTVVVDRPGGVDLDALAQATKLVSQVLDDRDPVAGRYTLEVSSPGLERRLRTPEHFRRAVGERVTVRTHAGTADDRRVQGTLVECDDLGIVVRGPEVPGGESRIAYEAIERARTVFEWGPKQDGKRTERVRTP